MAIAGKSFSLLVLVTALMLLVVVKGVVGECEDRAKIQDKVSPCISAGTLMNSPSAACCARVKELSLDCFCSLLQGTLSLSDFDAYVNTCALNVPGGFSCS
ncbi:uncharacterized protein LOC112346118 [Selaginella moellendorffii]|uniref:uncharacterized protein LOC112346118 n=1 Tax=Selaginella moellendorffii TaxID=88036 RepID=UPI000D1C34CB|nr:uncharacterized protein LOC112346118 [Selaginella moellendorffii]|eukprot:XP_024530020.1 uncharacterized protein LOC112346118 [Selaginella moellendorffii]